MVTSIRNALAAVIVPAFLLAGPAVAATVNLAAPGVAGSVTGVVVGANTYNVTFVGDVTHESWAGMLDFTTVADGLLATAALASALNASTATLMRFSVPGGSTFDHDRATTFYDADLTTLFGVSTLRNAGDTSWVSGAFSMAPINTAFPLAADWTLVPEPGTALLLGMGTALLSVRRRRGSRE